MSEADPASPLYEKRSLLSPRSVFRSPRSSNFLLSSSSLGSSTVVQSPSPEPLPSLSGRRSIYVSAITVLLGEQIKGAVYVNLQINGSDFLKLPFVYEPSDGMPLRWPLDPYFSLQEGNVLNVQFKKRRHWPKRSLHAAASVAFQDVYDMLSSADPGEPCQYIIRDDPTIILDLVLEAAGPPLADMLGVAIVHSKEVKSVLDHLGKSKQFLGTLLQYGAAISELDPIAKAILGCINVTYKKLREQDRYDKIIVDLSENMARSLDYIEDVGQFARLSQLKRTVEELRPLIEDTTNFILSYVHKTTTNRFFSATSIRYEVEELAKRFEIFQKQFDRGLAVQSGVTLDVLLDQLISNKGDQLLQELKPRILQREHSSRGAECMDGTRTDVLSSIDDWVDDLQAPNILWIQGFPGVGKSSIASTTVHNLRKKNRLGSCYIFDRAKATMATPNALWRSVAYDLARTYPAFRIAVVQSLDEEEVDVDSSNIKTIFRSLIEEPLLACTDIPMGRLPVVVVDALDECGGINSRQSVQREGLLSTLKRWAALPKNFKLLVTSRGDEDISRVLDPICETLDLSSGNHVKEEASDDIRLYLKARFRKVVKAYPESLPTDWPGDAIINELTNQAAGLFIWAKTLMDYVNEGEPNSQLDQILSGGIELGNVSLLYARVLETSFRLPGPRVLECFQVIAGAMIYAKRPLSRYECLELLGVEPSMLDYIRKGLRSVMDDGHILRFNHQSFVEFLLDPSQCHPAFAIKELPQHEQLAFSCIKIMNERLRFNICELPTSHLRNDDFKDLESRIVRFVTTPLTYACRFWTEHLRNTPFDHATFLDIKEFFYNKFLFWLEVLSAISKVYSAAEMLTTILEWSSCEENQDRSLVPFIEDALKFISAFSGVISQSAPHIYISALPFAPKKSIVAQHYLGLYPGTLRFQSGQVDDWPRIMFTIDEHEDCVTSASFSQDGKFIVSGSADKTVCVWDAKTGDLISSLEGHASCANSVSFSGDGRRVVSGSDDWSIHIWDAESGDVIFGPLIGHKSVVAAVAFSRSGAYAVSASYDCSICVWDVSGSEPSPATLLGHSAGVTSIALSSDDELIVSGSFDQTVRVWNVVSGQVIYGPFEGHWSAIAAVAFSPDNLFIAFADDRTIRMWDILGGDVSSGPFEGHTDAVTSVAFSSGGKLLLSGSEDETIRIWDVESGEPVGEPLRGHTNGITTISLSSGGRHLLSGARDGTICIWDVENPYHSSTTTQAHGDGVTAIAFSPHGDFIVSGSDDNTVRRWNYQLGVEEMRLVGHRGWIATISISPDGLYVASGSEDQTIHIWNLQTGELIGCLTGHRNTVSSIAFFPDSQRLVSGSYDETVRIWSVAELATTLGPIEPHTNWITSVAVSPDGTAIASASFDQTLKIMDAETGFTIAGPFEGHSGAINAVCFSGTGKLVASTSNDQTIRVWDVESGQLVFQPFTGHTHLVLCLSFSPNDDCIVSGSLDKTIRVWDLQNGNLKLGPLEGHTGGIFSVAYSPDGKLLASASEDNTIRIWDVASDQIVSEMRSVEAIDFEDDSALERGWIAGANASLLFWVPPWHRNGLWWPRNVAVIAESSTKLDTSCFENGLSWQNCRDLSSR